MFQDIFDTNYPSNVLSAAKQLKYIKQEMARLNTAMKKLREQKKPFEKILYDYMKAHELKDVLGIKIGSVKPKNVSARKPLSQKREDAIQLFRMEGLMDPESFWERFQQTQKSNQTHINSI